MRKCAFCGARNDQNDSFCIACGLAQITGPDGKPQITPKRLTERRQVGSVARLARPVMQWVAIAMAAVAVFTLGFVMGKATSGNAETDLVTTQPTPTTEHAGAVTRGTDETGAAVETTAAPGPATTAPATTTTTTTTTEPPFTYTDVPADYQYTPEIQALLDDGVVSPCAPPDGTEFCPDDFLTREALASVFAQMFRYDDPGDADLFVDDADSPFQSEIQAIAIAGITRGCNPPDDTKFCPKDLVTRGQLATFLDRALDLPPPAMSTTSATTTGRFTNQPSRGWRRPGSCKAARPGTPPSSAPTTR